MRAALALATDPQAPRGENPRVGCVIVDEQGTVIGSGFHRGAGTAHAEVVALAQASAAARGATAVVTLEPCRHTGRTGPCTQALIDAGVRRVVIAQPDPTREAGGGAHDLRSAGIEVVSGVLVDEAHAVNVEWTRAVRAGRPFVTVKTAMSLDGRVAGPGGTPLTITGEQARVYAHQVRSQVQAIIVGTGTVLADDPELTVRHGVAVVGEPPLRVVVGARSVPAAARICNAAAATWLAGSLAPEDLLAALYARGVRSVLVEGGPTLIASFMAAGVVDRWLWFIAPIVIGDGPTALATMDTVVGVDVVEVQVLGEDVCITAEPRRVQSTQFEE